MNILKCFILLLLFGMAAKCNAAPSTIESQIISLEPYIGGYPPNIVSINDLNQIKINYKSIKKQLDSMLKKTPHDMHLLYLRGHLQSMGHNIDIEGAWDGATSDLTSILKQEPKNVPASLELAELWVNSRPDLAYKAELLFQKAQCFSGATPLEEAQNGLFFALYYQGKMQEAYQQAHFLQQTWSSNQRYASYVSMTENNLKKNNKNIILPPTLSKNGTKNQYNCLQ